MNDSQPKARYLTPQGEGGYDRSWYALAVSAEIEPGTITGVDFLGGRVVVFRTPDGEPHVLSAYCRHLGADLTGGELVGDLLQCPFHHWRYGSDGVCRELASGDKVPTNARLFRFPVAESMGLIWAFNGGEPTFPVPSYDGVSDDELTLKAWRTNAIFGVSHNVMAINALDIQHLQVVHRINVNRDSIEVNMDDYGIDFSFESEMPVLGPVRQKSRVCGTGSVAHQLHLANGRTFYLMVSSTSIAPDKCIAFQSNAFRKGATAEEQKEVDQLLAGAVQMGLQLELDDLPILNAIRFRRDLLSASDVMISRGFEYMNGFPRTDPAAHFYN